MSSVPMLHAILGSPWMIRLTSRNRWHPFISLPFYHIRYIACIRRFLSEESTKALVHAFVTCRLDNCNSLLYGLPKNQIEKLQRVQNCAGRLVVNARRHDHITPVLKDLHWLPVDQRIVFKILLFTYKALNGLAPSYLSDLVKFYAPERNLRSSSQNFLAVPFSKTKSYGDRAFSVCAPTLWNDLPLQLTSSASFNILKSNLKTFLFKYAFCL